MLPMVRRYHENKNVVECGLTRFFTRISLTFSLLHHIHHNPNFKTHEQNVKKLVVKLGDVHGGQWSVNVCDGIVV